MHERLNFDVLFTPNSIIDRTFQLASTHPMRRAKQDISVAGDDNHYVGYS